MNQDNSFSKETGYGS